MGLDQTSKTGLPGMSKLNNNFLDQTPTTVGGDMLLMTPHLSPRGPPGRQNMPPSLSQIEGIFKDSDRSECANSINPKKKKDQQGGGAKG